MTDKEKIRAEVERQIPLHICGYKHALKDILKFIDSLPEEPVSKNIDEAGKKYGLNNPTTHFTADGIEHDTETPMFDFIEGANWMKEQIMKKSEEFFYHHLNDIGDVEFGDIGRFIEEFHKEMEAEK